MENEIIQLDSTNFSRFINDGGMVDFYADWCGPCKAMLPTIAKVAAEDEWTGKIGKLNIDEHADIAAKYNIRSIPTLIFFSEGGQISEKHTGMASADLIKTKLSTAFSKEEF